ncbi:MAG: hypothetical protein ACI4VW_02090 [Acutalibacteraceae bacterium]
MAVCPICGCKTEELDFVERKIIGEDCRVCSFCDKQLNVFDSDSEPTEAQIRWLDAVIGKEVSQRDDKVLSGLKSIRSRFPEKEVTKPVVPEQSKTNLVYRSTAQGNAEQSNEDDVVTELQNRVTALENELRAMKRKQMIKTIVELGAPFVLLLLLIIIVLNSGLIENVKSIFDMAGVAL